MVIVDSIIITNTKSSCQWNTKPFTFTCTNFPLICTGCQKSHRAGGCHGETENEGWSETGEQHIVSSRGLHHVEVFRWIVFFWWCLHFRVNPSVINHIYQRTTCNSDFALQFYLKFIIERHYNKKLCLKSQVFVNKKEILLELALFKWIILTFKYTICIL